MSSTLSLHLPIQPPLSCLRTILQMASLFLLRLSLANSPKGVNLLMLRTRPVVVHLWFHSRRNLHHQRSSLPHHLVSLLLGRKLILMVRRLKFHKPQRNLRDNDHRLHEPIPDIYGMKTAVFAYHPLKTTLSNHLHSTHHDLDNIDWFLTWDCLFFKSMGCDKRLFKISTIPGAFSRTTWTIMT